jgi:hypothetical protein
MLKETNNAVSAPNQSYNAVLLMAELLAQRKIEIGVF